MPTQLGWRSNVAGSNLEFVDEDSPLPVQLIQAAILAQGFNIFSLTALATTNLTTIKNVGPGQVYGWAIYNSSATVPAQVRLYDKGAALGGLPVIATDAGLIKVRIGVPATALGAGNNILMPGPVGLRFDNGIGLCTVTAAPGTLADTDSSAPAAGTLLVNIFWV